MAQAVRTSSQVFDDDRSKEVADLSLKTFGKLPKRVAFPGGESRSAFLVDMEDAIYVFARREDKQDAQFEGIVLKALGDTGFVPKLAAVHDQWVVQEFIEGTRVPVLLDTMTSMSDRQNLISKSLDALIGIHNEAANLNLQHRFGKVGSADNWLWDRTGAAKRMSKQAGIKPPKLDRDALVKLMDVKRDEFVKWDARPGNAMSSEKGIVWFDWEDCARSKALDDLAFVLCDEWTALDATAEAALIARYFDSFNRSLPLQRAEHYFQLFGITHCLLRIRMAQKLYHRKDKWWDRQYCLDGDKVGVTEQEVTRQVNRAKRWADGVSEYAPIIPWLDDFAAHYKL